MKKSDIGKLYSFKFRFTNKIEIYSGYVLDFNKDWILIKYNPVDYQIDGYVLLRDKYVTHFKREDDERFKEKVLNLKGYKPKASEKIPLTELPKMLAYITKKFGAFFFGMQKSDVRWLTSLKMTAGAEIILHDLTKRGKWIAEKDPLKYNSIRTIEFNTDYNNSLLNFAKKGVQGPKSRKK
jgi:hypothetical protein